MAIDKEKIISMLTDTPDSSSSMTNEDIQTNKNISLLSYLFCLFLIPRFTRKNSKFAQYHVNQGLTLFLVEIAGSIVFSILEKLPLIGFVFTIAKYAFNLATLVLTFLGLLNVSQGKAKQLPFIGKYTFLK